jgi:hypothetical protein
MPRPTPPVHVAPGELIDAAWGNSVTDDIDYSYSWFTAGSTTYFGALLFQGANLILTSDAAGSTIINFPIPYATAPVVFSNFFQNDYAYVTNVHTVNTVGFVYVLVNDSGGIVPNFIHHVQWGAFGPRLA